MMKWPRGLQTCAEDLWRTAKRKWTSPSRGCSTGERMQTNMGDRFRWAQGLCVNFTNMHFKV